MKMKIVNKLALTSILVLSGILCSTDPSYAINKKKVNFSSVKKNKISNKRAVRKFKNKRALFGTRGTFFDQYKSTEQVGTGDTSTGDTSATIPTRQPITETVTTTFGPITFYLLDNISLQSHCYDVATTYTPLELGIQCVRERGGSLGSYSVSSCNYDYLGLVDVHYSNVPLHKVVYTGTVSALCRIDSPQR